MRATSLIALLPAALLLSACGGDSSSDSSVAPPSPPVSGRAVKGIAQQAEVLAYQRVGANWSQVGATLTDDEGRFTFTNGLPAGVVRLVVQPTTAGTSRLVCDAASGCGAAGLDIGDTNGNETFDFGETMPMPEGFRMSTIIPGERPADYEVAITPVTHLMASYLERLPVVLEDKHVAMARAQIEGLLDVDDNFLWQAPPDLTDLAEVDVASAEALHHALVSAAFAELGGAEPQTVLNTYAYRYAGLAGQLPVSYGSSMHALAFAASRVLAHVNQLRTDAAQAPLDAAAPFEAWAGMTGTLTRVALDGEYNPDNLARARLSLDELDLYLNQAGIDENGNFLATQAAQFSWVNNSEMLGLLQTMFESVAAVVAASLQASIGDIPGAPPMPATIDIGLVSEGLTATLDTTTTPMQLTIAGESVLGQTVNIVVGITPIIGGIDQGVLTYTLISGEIDNARQTGDMQGTFKVEFYNNTQGITDLLIDYAMDPASINDPMVQDTLAAFLSVLHVRASIEGSMSLAATAAPDDALTGAIDAWAEIDVPALQNENDLLQIQLTSGYLESPNGDRLYSLEGSEPALRITVDDNATLDAAFGFEAFTLPAMEVTASGALNGLDTLVASIITDLMSQEMLDLNTVISVLMDIDISLLDLAGTGTLDIFEDTGTKHWDFVLDGNRFDASQPNSTENALSFYLVSLEGGFILSGGEPVAAVTIDWLDLGAAIYSIDGAADHYYAGSVEELLAVLPVAPLP